METLGSKMEVLRTMSTYGWGTDYLTKEEDVTRNMTLEQHKALAEKYIDPDKMIYVVAGDANTQFEALKAAGFDEVYLLDSEGKPKEFAKSLKPPR
jgi:zinc protease